MNTNTSFNEPGIESLLKGLSETMETESPKESVKRQLESTSTNIKIMNAGVADPALVASGVTKINAIYNELSQMFMERTDIIKMCLVAIITEQPVLLLGPHGSAKSALINEICDRIVGAEYFSWLLNKVSDVSEILGPFSIKAMEQDKFLRVTSNKLPEAEIAFLDEVYKSNAPTLNALLTIMNEKIFYNDGKPVSVPLFTLFGASNEPPEEDGLMPLHDRFIFRVVVEYLKDTSSITKMCQDFISKRAGNNIISRTTITIDEIRAMQLAAKKMLIPNVIIKQYVNILLKLKSSSGGNVTVSDRRKNECLKIMQGSAVFRGSNVVGYEDFQLLPFALWEEPEQLPTIVTELSKLKNPSEDEFNKLKNAFESIVSSIETAQTPDDKMKAALQNKAAVSQIVSKLSQIIVKTKGSSNTAFAKEVEEFKKSATTYITDNMEKYISVDSAFNF